MGFLNAGKPLGITGGVIAAAGAVLPWWIASASVSGFITVSIWILGITTVGGMLALVFGILGLVFSVLKPPLMGIVVAVMGLLTVLVSVTYGVAFPTASVSVGSVSGSVSPGFGFWVSLVGGLLLLAGGPLVYLENKKAEAVQPMPVPPMA